MSTTVQPFSPAMAPLLTNLSTEPQNLLVGNNVITAPSKTIDQLTIANIAKEPPNVPAAGSLMAQRPADKAPEIIKPIREIDKKRAEMADSFKAMEGVPMDDVLNMLNRMGLRIQDKETTDIQNHLNTLSKILEFSKYKDPASLAAGYEQLGNGIRVAIEGANINIRNSTLAIQKVTVYLQRGLITATEARQVIAGEILNLQRTSAKIGVLTASLAQTEKKMGLMDQNNAFTRLQQQLQTTNVNVRTAIGVQRKGIETLKINVETQQLTVANGVNGNNRELNGILLRGRQGVERVTPDQRSRVGIDVARREANTAGTLMPPMLNTLGNSSEKLSLQQRSQVLEAVLPISDTKPIAVASGNVQKALDPSTTGNVIRNDIKTIERGIRKLEDYKTLPNLTFRKAFAADYATVSNDIARIRNGSFTTASKLTFATDAAVSNDLTKLINIRLQEAKAEVVADSQASPEYKKWILNLKEQGARTLLLSGAFVGLNEGQRVFEVSKAVKDIVTLLRRGGTPKDGNPFEKLFKELKPTTSVASLPNVEGQYFRTLAAEQAPQVNKTLQGAESLAFETLSLAKQSQLLSIQATQQAKEGKKTAVMQTDTARKTLDARIEANQSRLKVLGTTELSLNSAQDAVSVSEITGNLSITRATADQKVAKQNQRIVKLTENNADFRNNLNLVADAGIQYNTRVLDNIVKNGVPELIIRTGAGLVVPQQLLYHAQAEVQKSTGKLLPYDAPAVIKMAEQLTYREFASQKPEAAGILLKSAGSDQQRKWSVNNAPSNKVGLAAIDILANGTIKGAQVLSPITANGNAASRYQAKVAPTRVVWRNENVAPQGTVTPPSDELMITDPDTARLLGYPEDYRGPYKTD